MKIKEIVKGILQASKEAKEENEVNETPQRNSIYDEDDFFLFMQ